MAHALIGLGSNLGNRSQTLRRAVSLVTREPGVRSVAVSQFLETPPVGGPAGQGHFLNAALRLETDLGPEQLHATLRRIEGELGRQAAPRWAARVIDLDLLLYDDLVMATTNLAIPHPRMVFRRFVLDPAAQVAPDMVHPLAGWTIGRLLAHLNTAAPYIALLGTPGPSKATLAQSVAQQTGGAYLGNPASPAENPPIQFLDRAAGLLASHDWTREPTLAVSDFFLDECLAHARATQTESEAERVYEAWTTHSGLPRPRLLVVLDTFAAAVAARVRRSSSLASPTERLRHELLLLAVRPNQGPVLFAGSDDPRTQLTEIVAAIAAMD